RGWPVGPSSLDPISVRIDYEGGVVNQRDRGRQRIRLEPNAEALGSGTWAPTKSRRAGLSAANPELVAYPAGFAVPELDCDHVLGRPDNPERGVGIGVKDFGAVAAAFAGRDIAVIACCIEGQPVRSAAAFQCQSLFENRGHRIIHCPDINMRVIPAAA